VKVKMVRGHVLKAVRNTCYLVLIIAIFMLVVYSTGCAGDSGKVVDYASLIDNLRKAGAIVYPGGEFPPDFLSAKRMIISVNGSDVNVWEYDDTASADAEAALISPDGFSLNTATKSKLVGWIASLHFYKAGRLIVLYVGESKAVTIVLERVLGSQFAGQ